MVKSSYVNPMEWVGEAHNAALRYAASKLNKSKATPQNVQKHLAEYFAIAGIYERKSTRIVWYKSPHQAVDAMLKEGRLTRPVAKALRALIDTSMKQSGLRETLREIERQERAALRSLRGLDLLDFQRVIAVARHSARLWAPQEQGGEGLVLGGGSGPATIWGREYVFDYTYVTYHNDNISTLASANPRINPAWIGGGTTVTTLPALSGKLGKLVANRDKGSTAIIPNGTRVPQQRTR